MIVKHVWALPAVTGTVCCLLALVSFSVSDKQVVGELSGPFAVDQTAVISNLSLEEGKKYAIEMVAESGLPVGRSSVVSASLTRGAATVFEVEDAWWHERGVWREGGESGTWDEQNSKTWFAFAVPETGVYELEVTLVATSGYDERIGARVLWVNDFPLSAWPLLLGGLALFGLAGAAYLGARGSMARILEQMGPGSRLTVDGKEYSVIERTEEWEAGSRVGMEFRLRDADGLSRYLAIDRFEREHPYAEDEDQIVTEILFDVPLTPDELEKLGAVGDGTEWVMLAKDEYRYDRENSGAGAVVRALNGETYRSDYYAHVYRGGGGKFPIQPGERWLVLVRWRETDDIEWSLMEVLDYRKIDVLEVIGAEQVDLAGLGRKRSAAPPPAITDFFSAPPPSKGAQEETHQVANRQNQSPFDRDGEG